MNKRNQPTDVELSGSKMDLNHLRRDSRTALELAIVALAPEDLVDRLATAAGLLEALEDLPRDSTLVIALVQKVVSRARRALEDWQEWNREHLEKKLPQG